MSFLNKLVEGITHQSQSQQQSGPPQPPHPWRAEWDGQAQRWVYINQENGQRSHEFPQSQYGGGQYGPGYGQQYSGQQQTQYNQGPPKKSGMGYGGMALAAGAGLAGGALLMHEGEKVERKWDQDKDRFENRVEYDKDRFENRVDYDEDRVENRVRYDKDRVEDFPNDAARWGGRKLQEVEDIPQDIDRKWDNAVNDVEDVPNRVAGFFGREEGRIDRFDDGIENSFDQGRDEERYDDDDY